METLKFKAKNAFFTPFSQVSVSGISGGGIELTRKPHYRRVIGLQCWPKVRRRLKKEIGLGRQHTNSLFLRYNCIVRCIEVTFYPIDQCVLKICARLVARNPSSTNQLENGTNVLVLKFDGATRPTN